MGAKTIFFDFDETLVDTSKLRPYRQTREGRQFIANHPDQVNTKHMDIDLLLLFNGLAAKNYAAIATNSSLDYTRTLLGKHGFSIDIPIYYNLHKPCHEGLSCAIKDECKQVDDAMYVGDSASDILATHGCRIPSVAVTWGNTSTLPILQKAEPTGIVENVKDLKSCILAFINGGFAYRERINPEAFIFLNDPQVDAEVEYHSLFTYYPTGHQNFYGSRSNEILRFKDIKDFSLAEVHNGASSDYFYNGEVKKGLVLKDVFIQFYRNLAEYINKLNLKGKSFVIAAPNSAPEYCYKSDVNQIMANMLNRQMLKINDAYLKRILFRVHPKRESHLSGSRNESEHFETIGIKKSEGMPDNLDNLIIFDDVSTTKTQLTCLAKTLKAFFNFNRNLIGITLGQTTDEYL